MTTFTAMKMTSRGPRALAAASLAVAALAMSASPALAAPPSVAWSVQSLAYPTNFSSKDSSLCAGCDHYLLNVENVGSVESSGMITLTDTLPSGVTTAGTPKGVASKKWACTPTGAGHQVVVCNLQEKPLVSTPVRALGSAEALEVPVKITGSPPATLVNSVTVESPEASVPDTGEERTALVASALEAPPFAPLDFSSSALDGAGALDTQAGARPAALTASFSFPSALKDVGSGHIEVNPVEQVDQIVIDLPAGVVGDPQAAPKCPLANILDFNADPNACPRDTQVGTLVLDTPTKPFFSSSEREALKIFNVVPEQGHPAEFGAYLGSVQKTVLLYASVRSGSDYGLQLVSTPNILQDISEIVGIESTFFGDPASRDASGNAQLPFFANPTDCGPSFTTTIHVDTWQHPGRFNADGTPDLGDPNWKSSSSVSPPVSGCEALHFHPELEVAPAEPEVAAADSPSGLRVDLRVPQNEDVNGLATPELKDAVVKLPVGMAVSPSAASGLAACSPGQLGLSDGNAPSCPDASKIGAVEIVTPALEHPLKGSLYVAQQGNAGPAQGANPFGSLLAIYLVAEGSGVVVKLAGHVEADPQTGRLTTRFEGNPPFEGLPQQQFSDLKLHFFGGPRAALITPPACGTYPVSSQLTPWSSLTASEPPSNFTVGAGCAAGGFSPSFSAGTTNNQAGGYSPLSVTFSRQDGEQRLAGITVHTPPGLLGKIAGIPQCPEAQANAGTCPAASQIGTTIAGAGAGPDPFYVPEAGQPASPVYLTGPYKGAPFGLSIVVHALAGPFDLGNVIVRAAIAIDPHTAQITVTSDPLPSILQGIPLDLRTVNVTVDRPGFMFNPTNCSPISVSGTITSTQGTAANVSSRFQASECRSLPFKPTFKVSTGAKSSRSGGASLDVKVGSGTGQANIAKVHVSLPKQLPSRNSTLKLACLAAVFNFNPASCAAGSKVGGATAITPVLAKALTGPAYLVSHGGAAFPDLEVVLQGEGITLILDGRTDIKKGITTSSFDTVPDAPISSFELKLPVGAHSALAAPGGKLCSQKLTMPTSIQGQNGALVKQTTKIAITGCAKHKKLKAKKKGKKAYHKRK